MSLSLFLFQHNVSNSRKNVLATADERRLLEHSDTRIENGTNPTTNLSLSLERGLQYTLSAAKLKRTERERERAR